MANLKDYRYLLLIIVCLLIIIPFQKSFSGNCIKEFKPKIQQMKNDFKIGQYTTSLSKKTELNGKKGIITYGATTIKVMKASMLKRYEQKAQIQAKRNYLRFVKKSSSTIRGTVTLESCTKDILGTNLMIIKVFTPL